MGAWVKDASGEMIFNGEGSYDDELCLDIRCMTEELLGESEFDPVRIGDFTVSGFWANDFFFWFYSFDFDWSYCLVQYKHRGRTEQFFRLHDRQPVFLVEAEEIKRQLEKGFRGHER